MSIPHGNENAWGKTIKVRTSYGGSKINAWIITICQLIWHLTKMINYIGSSARQKPVYLYKLARSIARSKRLNNKEKSVFPSIFKIISPSILFFFLLNSLDWQIFIAFDFLKMRLPQLLYVSMTCLDYVRIMIVAVWGGEEGGRTYATGNTITIWREIKKNHRKKKYSTERFIMPISNTKFGKNQFRSKMSIESTKNSPHK